MRFPDDLHCAKVTIVPQQRCRRVYPASITSNMLCAGEQRNRADSCQVGAQMGGKWGGGNGGWGGQMWGGSMGGVRCGPFPNGAPQKWSQIWGGSMTQKWSQIWGIDVMQNGPKFGVGS